MKAQIMAIGNVTPDSFYASSRLNSEREIVLWAERALREGADILDIGACSTRPGSIPVGADEEWARLEPAITAIHSTFPEARLSIDTFRVEVAQKAIERCEDLIINDISGGCEEMYRLARAYHIQYIWTLRGQLDLSSRMPFMQDMNLILDPGFGFIGSTEGDYTCLRQMETLRQYELPILVGVSRKSMIYKPLSLTPETCLCATQALQLYALEHGATILRTHDVPETAQTITLWERIQGINS